MFSSKHAKFHAFITKVNNSALFWPLAARLISIYLKQIERNNSNSPSEFMLHTWLFILALYFALKFAVRTNTP